MDNSPVEESPVQIGEEKKESRWWVAYHLWAGVCLKAYTDASGLSKNILGTLRGSDVSSASNYAVGAAIIAVGAFALGYFLSKVIIKAVNNSALPKTGKIIVKSILPVVYIVGAVLLAMITGPDFAESNKFQKTTSPVSQQSSIKPVQAFTTVQSSDGATESDLNQEVLSNIETWLVETMLQKGRNKYAEMGYNPKDFNPKISANSVYVTAGGKKLAVIKINMNQNMRTVTIMGIKGNEFQRVNCIRASNHDIPVWSGPCGDEVRKTFGVSLQP